MMSLPLPIDLTLRSKSSAGVVKALDDAEKHKGAPTIIIADTIKGKGVSFMECKPTDFHGKAPSKEELVKALEELI